MAAFSVFFFYNSQVASRWQLLFHSERGVRVYRATSLSLSCQSVVSTSALYLFLLLLLLLSNTTGHLDTDIYVDTHTYIYIASM